MHRNNIMIFVGDVMSALGVFRALEVILSTLEVSSALEGISSALGRICIVMEHPQCNDNIPNTYHDIPDALMISLNAMNTSMHCIHII